MGPGSSLGDSHGIPGWAPGAHGPRGPLGLWGPLGLGGPSALETLDPGPLGPRAGILFKPSLKIILQGGHGPVTQRKD